MDQDIVNSRTIKMVSTNDYEIILIETPEGKYRILADRGGIIELGEEIEDYKTSSFLFDLKIEDMESQIN